MPSILVATGFVRIDADTRPALKSLQALGSIGASALSTTLIPAAAAASAAVLAVGSAAATAGAAVGAYGVAVSQQFNQISEASQKQKTAEEAKAKATTQAAIAQKLAKENGFQYGKQVEITKDMTDAARQKAEEYNSALSASKSATKAARESQEAYKAKMAELPPATRDTAEALQNLKDSTTSWSDSLSSSTMPVFTRGIQFLESLLPKLTPIVKDVAAEVEDFVGTLGEGTAGRVFREFGQNVTANGAGALRTFLEVGKNLTVGILGILNAFQPMSQEVTGGLQGLTERFAEFGATLGENQGFQRFLEIARDAAPRLGEALSALSSAFLDVASAAGPLSGIGLTVLTVFARIVDAIPTPVLELLVPAILAVNLALKAYAIYQAAATAATWLFSTAVVTSGGAMYASRAAMLAAIAAFIWHRIVSIASTVATWAWTAATYAFAVAQLAVVAVIKGLILVVKGLGLALKFLFTNPIGLAILALVALGVGLYMAWKRSETFRNIVKGALNAVKDVAVAIGNWFAGPFARFFTETIPNAFRTVLDWVKRNWPWILGALTGPIGLAVVYIIKHWDGIKKGIASAWESIKRNVLTPIKNFFTQTIPGWAKSLRDRVVSFFMGVLTGYVNIFKAIRDRVFTPIKNFFTSTIPGWARTVRDRVVGHFSGLRDRLVDAYNSIRSRVFNPIRTFFTSTIPGWARTLRDKVKGFFGEMRDGIGRIWDGIKSKVKAPINWVIRNIWNNGIRSLWGKITGWIGIKNSLGRIKELASGGTVGRGFGQRATPGVFNRPTAIVGEGNPNYPEFVIPTDPKYKSRAQALWQAAGVHFMEDGGVLGWLGDKAKDVGGAIVGGVKGIADFMTDPVGKAKKILLGALGGMGKLGNSPWVKMITKLPRMAVDALIDKVKDLGGDLLGAIGLGKGNGGSGVARWRQVVQVALRQVGQPAAYTDLTLRRMNQESGGNPTVVNKWDSNWQRGTPSVGLMQVIGPTFRAYAGRYRSTGPFLYGVSVNPLANIYSSMKYALSRYGSLPRAYNRAGGYRNGTGGTTSGWHLFGEAGPELGFSPAGWRVLNARQTAGMGRSTTVIERLVVENHGVIASRREAEDWLVESLDQLRRKGRIK